MEKTLNNNPKQNNLHVIKTQTHKIPHINKTKNSQNERYPTKNNFYSTYNINLKEKEEIKTIKKVKSFTKKSSITSRNKYNSKSGTISHNNSKKKFSFSKKSSSNTVKLTDSNINNINNNDILDKSRSKNVKVFVRFRPANEVESSLLQNNSGWLVPRYISETNLGIYTEKVLNVSDKLIFSFDKIFTPKNTQEDIYSSIGSRLVEDIMAGYNGTILTYGQSGSGKTYTMYGEDIFDENKKGIIPRIVCEIFKRMEKIEDVDFTVKLSVLEIYKEILYDLFTGKNNLKIIENKEKIYVDNLSQIYLSSLNEFFDYTE